MSLNTISVNKSKFTRVTRRALQYIKDHYREINGKCGWHQHLGSNKIGNIASAQALLSLAYFREGFNEKHKVISTIVESQFSMPGDGIYDGGWAYKTNASIIPTTECTCWVLLLLGKEQSGTQDSFEKGLRWLLNNCSSKDGGAGWGNTRFDSTRTYATTLALRVLSSCGYVDTQQYKQGLAWLKNARNPSDGGWGEARGYSSTFLHTAHALITLKQCGVDVQSEFIWKGSDWLLNSFHEETLWDEQSVLAGLIEQMEVSIPSNTGILGQRVVYFHFVIPWIITALISCSKISTSQSFKAVNWLLNSFHDGYWDHPYLRYLKNKPMSATHDALLALSTFMSSMSNFAEWDEIEKISLTKNELNIKQKRKPPISFWRRFISSKITRLFMLVVVIGIVLGITGAMPFIWVIATFFLSFLASLLAILVLKK